MRVSFTSRGDWGKTEAFLKSAQTKDISSLLSAFGERGVGALSAATPTDTGETSQSWYYEVVHRKGYWSVRWHNRNIDENGTPIAILIQYGHGTRQGGYVQGLDYIMPALRPIFDELANEAWKVVNNG